MARYYRFISTEDYGPSSMVYLTFLTHLVSFIQRLAQKEPKTMEVVIQQTQSKGCLRTESTNKSEVTIITTTLNLALISRSVRLTIPIKEA